MKKVYWRPRQVSRTVLVLIALLSAAGLAAVETLPIKRQQGYYEEKMTASQCAREAMDRIREERLVRGWEIDPVADPAESGLIGSLISPVTSNTGVLAAKQTTVNPNFAAVVVDLLKSAGAEQGDLVAVGFSGSFPALNICVGAAIKTLGLKPIIVSSVSASQWGANDPNFMWIDMERVLNEANLVPFRTTIASIGGIEDRGLGMSEEGRQLVVQAIERNGLPMIKSKGFAESIDQHMKTYLDGSRGKPIRAYINVGGGATSVGTRVGKRLFQPGLNRFAPPGSTGVDSVMTRFISRGVPVIHLVEIDDLARKYGLPLQPARIPTVGEGNIFARAEYNLWLAGGVLAAILISLYAFIRSEWGIRILRTSARRKEADHIEPMI